MTGSIFALVSSEILALARAAASGLRSFDVSAAITSAIGSSSLRRRGEMFNVSLFGFID
jgi:hypothetical protein